MITPTSGLVTAPTYRVTITAMRTRLTEMLGIEHPVMLAGMGGVSYHRVVAAVSDAGGIGTLGAATMEPDELVEEMARCATSPTSRSVSICSRRCRSG